MRLADDLEHAQVREAGQRVAFDLRRGGADACTGVLTHAEDVRTANALPSSAVAVAVAANDITPALKTLAVAVDAPSANWVDARAAAERPADDRHRSGVVAAQGVGAR